MARALLEVKGIDVFYGDAQAIWDVTFHVDEGKIVALVGANCAGKSTVLNTISGLIQPKKGEIFFSGRALTRMRPEDIVGLGLCQVPEGRRLFGNLTVLENLELGAFTSRARPFLKESLERVFNLFPVLNSRVHQKAGSLSGGEQQMLAIARALMGQPMLLMLDEPSLGLAPMVVKLMFEIIEFLRKERVTILVVEQNVRQTLEIADMVYVLKIGKLELSGKGDELLMNPDFKRAYLGTKG